MVHTSGTPNAVSSCPGGGTLLVLDSLYTRNVLGRKFDLLSNRKSVILGIVLFNNIDSVNRHAVKRAMDDLSYAESGVWKMCQVFH